MDKRWSIQTPYGATFEDTGELCTHPFIWAYYSEAGAFLYATTLDGDQHVVL